jgi:hypothetical protein
MTSNVLVLTSTARAKKIDLSARSVALCSDPCPGRCLVEALVGHGLGASFYYRNFYATYPPFRPGAAFCHRSDSEPTGICQADHKTVANPGA